jgi:predicted nucleic acid-binding protein
MVVVADTSPINYLVLIEQIDLLTRLYRRILIPPAVLAAQASDRTETGSRLGLRSALYAILKPSMRWTPRRHVGSMN